MIGGMVSGYEGTGKNNKTGEALMHTHLYEHWRLVLSKWSVLNFS